MSIATTAVAAENECANCHEDPAFFAEYPKLNDYYQQWMGSPHQQSGLSCSACHGGDPDSTSAVTAHVGVLPMNDADSTLHYQKQPDTCGQCHRANRNQFVQSKHFTALMGQRAAPTCTTCHPAMSGRPELRVMVLNACRNCHGEGNSENLPLIADLAEHVFQQLNIAGGLLGWTRIHYESGGWPDDSRERMERLSMRHGIIINQVHRFDLGETEAATAALLGELREMFDAARQAHEQRSE
jgi:hypothetical protein